MAKKNIVEVVSAGLFVKSMDLVLFSASLGLNLYAASFKPKDPISILIDSLNLTAEFREKMLYNSSSYAKNRGYLERRIGRLKLTVKGRQYVQKLVPEYKQKRFWTGRLYLVTYDIRERSRVKRDQLRRVLKLQRGVMIQKSVWMSVYDPSNKLKELKWLRPEDGTVLVSLLKRGEGLGGETIDRLVRRVYQLNAINKQYSQFIKSLQIKKRFSEEEKLFLKMRYLAILRDDPQLPRGLLFNGWLGDKAYNLAREKLIY